MLYRKSLALVCACLLFLPCLTAFAAATGSLSGSITDPKGAVISGAVVTVTDPATNQIFTARTDAQGRYKIEGVPAGAYIVTITADGFRTARRESVKIADGGSGTLDVQLELAPLEGGSVEVSASGQKPNTDPVYQQLRQLAEGATNFNVATVNNLMLKRDAGEFTLRSGELYFLPPIEGRTVAAVFIGDGEFKMTPPVEIERKHLAIFTDAPTITEPFTELVLRFTDKTFDEVKESPNARMSSAPAQNDRARSVVRDVQYLLRKRLRENIETRTLLDLLSPNSSSGFFTAFIKGKRFDKLVYMLDPLGLASYSPEQVALASYGEADWGGWASFFLADEYKMGRAKSTFDRRLFDITHHDIEGAIRGTQLTATDRLQLHVLKRGLRVLPFELFGSLRVARVQDAQGRDLNFIQEKKDEDSDLAVILPEAAQANQKIELVVQYAGGDAISDSGGGNFILIPQARTSWYPNNAMMRFGDRAIFNMKFRFPKGNTFVGTGALNGAESQDGDSTISSWSSGTTELAVSGFNYGKFKKKELIDKDTNYGIEFYANKEVPDEIKAMQHNIERAEQAGVQTYTTLGAISTTGMADAAIADTQNSMRIYNAFFGKLPYTRIAMSQQPAGNFGQAWPTLVFMPYTAYINTTQRVQMMGTRGGTDTFWQYVGPHEVAHQWWGHVIGWSSYRDQWMSEGFAEFSTSLWVQFVRRDLNKFIDFWEAQRERIITATPRTKGRRPYTVGPVVQGSRLSSGKTGGAYQMVYPKGAYVLHMLRMMMYDQPRGSGDKNFQLMMKDFVQTYYNRNVSTENFKSIVDKHITPGMDITGSKRLDWFFDQWVYGTEMPSYNLEYKVNGTTLTGTLTQSGVSDKFRMLVPLYADFGKGWTRLGNATLTGNTTVNIPDIQLPQAPKRVAVAALNDVLALEIKNTKK